MDTDEMWILIPAYNPDSRLNALIDDLIMAGFKRVVIVNDGSRRELDEIFDKAKAQGATVLEHANNRGKGAALKTGVKYISSVDKTPRIITADSDGQHTPGDIMKIAECAKANPDALIIGSRDKRLMPLRSLMGNSLTCFFFWLTTGLWVNDTQTGLRAIPANAVGLFSQIAGDRYEYEMNMLIMSKREGIRVKEVKIETVYIDNNSSSHFDAVKDSARIYALLFRQFGAYAGSSITAMGIDYGLAVLLRLFFPNEITIPTYTARFFSSLFNYFTNSRLVFKKDKDNKYAVVKYYLLVAAVAVAQVQLIRLFSYAFSLSYLLSKIIADSILFIINFNVQKALVFRKIRLKTHK